VSGEKEKQTKDASYKEFLHELENMGCKIHWFKDGDFKIPKPFDTFSFPESKRSDALKILILLSEYVQHPAIEDWIDDHLERRKWRNEIDPQLSGVYDMNRLRGGEISAVFIGLEMLNDWLCPKDSKKRQIRAILGQVKLVKSSAGEKNTLEYVDFLTASVLDVLNFFGRNEDQKQTSG